MKALEPYLAWIKAILLLGILLLGIWVGFQAGSARSQKELAKLQLSVATTLVDALYKQITTQSAVKVEYVDKVEYITKWKTKKEVELVHVSQPLAQCVLSDDAVRLHNEARDCALQANSSGCRLDVEVRSSGTTVTNH